MYLHFYSIVSTSNLFSFTPSEIHDLLYNYYYIYICIMLHTEIKKLVSHFWSVSSLFFQIQHRAKWNTRTLRGVAQRPHRQSSFGVVAVVKGLASKYFRLCELSIFLQRPLRYYNIKACEDLTHVCNLLAWPANLHFWGCLPLWSLGGRRFPVRPWGPHLLGGLSIHAISISSSMSDPNKSLLPQDSVSSSTFWSFSSWIASTTSLLPPYCVRIPRFHLIAVPAGLCIDKREQKGLCPILRLTSQ